MRKIHHPAKVAAAISKSVHRKMLESLPVDKFLLEYRNGEFVAAPGGLADLFLIVATGEVSIYIIRDDGSHYALARSGSGSLLGETDVLGIENESVYAQAVGPLKCIAFSIAGNRELLLDNNLFLRTLLSSFAEKMAVLMRENAVPITLEERVLYYIRYKCENAHLKGVERAAFHLHCSTRQLQRILNRYAEEGRVLKTGKGSYRLLDGTLR